jgi:hypothetical protein
MTVKLAYLQGLMTERETLAANVESYAVRAAERGTDLTDAETTELAQLQSRCAEIDVRIGAFADAQEGNRRYAELMGRVNAGETRQREQAESTGLVSTGQVFIDSGVLGEYRGHGQSAMVECPDPWSLAEFRAPAVLASFPSLGHTQLPQPMPRELFPLFSLVNVETVDTNAFDYVVDTFTDNSAVVAEGAVKPESTLVQTLVAGTLETIAHWTQISRQGLEDNGRVRSLIDGKLTLGVQRKQHASLGAALVAAVLPTNALPVGPSLLESIRVGQAVVEAAGFVPNAVLLNPADYATLDIASLAALGGLIAVNGQSRFWGMQAVSYTGQAAGTATVGDFSEGLTLFRRSGVQIYATDSHASAFTSNIITILGEARSKAVVTNTAAFVECTAGA